VSYKIIPNILTILRILLVLPCAYFFYIEYYKLSIGIFILAAATDCVDGFLARKLGCQTELGAILDPLADKFLIIALFVVLTIKFYIPFWFSIIIILRELVLLGGATFYRYKFGPVVFIPTMISKINTCLLMSLLLITLIQAMLNYNLDYFKDYLFIIILLTSIYSALVYIWRWGIKVNTSLKANKK